MEKVSKRRNGIGEIEYRMAWEKATAHNLPLDLTAAWRNAVLGATLSDLDSRRRSAARSADVRDGTDSVRARMLRSACKP